MNTVSGFKTAEEAAIDLELPLLGTLPAVAAEECPVAPYFPEDERARREYGRAGDRVLLSPLSRQKCVGLIGDLPAASRARVSANLAAALAAQKTTTLVDGDLRGAFLSFDDRGRAQEGLVDVLRYGVRSPRVVAPTQAPGLSLLPVGSDTVDYAGTYGSETTPALFEELRRSGDLLVVNGPAPGDREAAEPFMTEVGAWIVLHELGRSDSKLTRELRDTLGRDRCVGILVVESSEVEAPIPSGLPASEAGAMEADVSAGLASAVAGAPEESEPPPVSEAEFGEPAHDEGIVPEEPLESLLEPTSEAEEFKLDERGAPAGEAGALPPDELYAEPDWPTEEEPRRGRLVGILGGVGVVAIIVAAFLWFRQGSKDWDFVPGVPDSPPRPAPGADVSRGAVQEEVPHQEETSGTEPSGDAVTGGAVARDGAPTGDGAGEDAAAANTSPSRAFGNRNVDLVISGPGDGSSRVSESTTAKPPDASRAAAKPTGEAFTVHVSSLRTAASARSEARRIEKAGFPTMIREEMVAGKGRWFRVYVGPYGERESANTVAGEIRSSGLAKYTRVYRQPEGQLREGMGQGDR